MTDREKETILSNLKAKIRGACPMCGGNKLGVQDQFVSSPTISLGGGTVFGGKMVPMVQVLCDNCGFVAHHAVGALGIKLGD